MDALSTLPGVGPKVAACIALFSLDHHHAIPVDTHVWQVSFLSFLYEMLFVQSDIVLKTTHRLCGMHGHFVLFECYWNNRLTIRCTLHHHRNFLEVDTTKDQYQWLPFYVVSVNAQWKYLTLPFLVLGWFHRMETQLVVQSDLVKNVSGTHWHGTEDSKFWFIKQLIYVENTKPIQV